MYSLAVLLDIVLSQKKLAFGNDMLFFCVCFFCYSKRWTRSTRRSCRRTIGQQQRRQPSAGRNGEEQGWVILTKRTCKYTTEKKHFKLEFFTQLTIIIQFEYLNGCVTSVTRI